MLSPTRVAGWFLVAAILFGVTSCANFGKVLGTRHVDIPLGEAGIVEVNAQSVTPQTATVRIDSIPLPERLWVAQDMQIDEGLSFRSSQSSGGTSGTGKSGVIEVGLLIDGYPAALWSLAVENGDIEAVKPETMPVPGKQKEREEATRLQPFPFPQWPKLRNLFYQLPGDQRPEVADELSFSIASEETVENQAWAEVFRGIHSGLKRREFTVTLLASTEQSLRGTLTVKTLEFSVFDSGQRLMGGTETAEE
jgi:hypothetical protein